jgi:hypothetical protein
MNDALSAITKQPPETNKLANDPANTIGAPDPFDLTALRLDQTFVETAGVKKLLNTVPVGKPNPQDFVRIRPENEFRETFAMIELKEDREYYVLQRDIARELPGEFFMATLFTCINRQRVLRLVPVKLPGPDGRVNEWHRSLMDGVEAGIHHWVRIKANMALGAYEIFQATGTIPDPVWPDETFQELLRIAFRDRVVDRVDHPLIKRLRGLG